MRRYYETGRADRADRADESGRMGGYGIIGTARAATLARLKSLLGPCHLWWHDALRRSGAHCHGDEVREPGMQILVCTTACTCTWPGRRGIASRLLMRLARSFSAASSAAALAVIDRMSLRSAW